MSVMLVAMRTDALPCAICLICTAIEAKCSNIARLHIIARKTLQSFVSLIIRCHGRRPEHHNDQPRRDTYGSSCAGNSVSRIASVCSSLYPAAVSATPTPTGGQDSCYSAVTSAFKPNSKQFLFLFQICWYPRRIYSAQLPDIMRRTTRSLASALFQTSCAGNSVSRSARSAQVSSRPLAVADYEHDSGRDSNRNGSYVFGTLPGDDFAAHGLVKHGLVKPRPRQARPRQARPRQARPRQARPSSSTASSSNGLVKHGLVKHGLVKHGLIKLRTSPAQVNRAEPFPIRWGNPNAPYATSASGPNYLHFLMNLYNATYVRNWNMAYFGASVDRWSYISTSTNDAVPSLDEQISQYWAPYYRQNPNVPWSPSNTLFSFWFGINDKRLLRMGTTPPLNGSEIQMADFTNYTIDLELMYSYGARNFLLINVPPTYRTPGWINFQPDSSRSMLQNYIATWNADLSALVNTLQG
ncbi:hypothetical protein MRB53_036967 [Persea americana]|nr:hypothetical protein MRB53_036967 [Persea americana]